MKIIIDQIRFSYDIGCRLLKLKHKECPFPEMQDFWDDIKPMTFAEIAKFQNIEERRVGIVCLGLDRLVQEVKPELVNRETLTKTTTWINAKGEMQTLKFDDTYELYKVSGSYFSQDANDRRFFTPIAQDVYYVKCKDTSTDRYYLIWVDLGSVYRTNNENSWDFKPEKVNAIQAVAWTITTNVPRGNIDMILRQGDCVLIKPKQFDLVENRTRHLTEHEYKTLLGAES